MATKKELLFIEFARLTNNNTTFPMLRKKYRVSEHILNTCFVEWLRAQPKNPPLHNPHRVSMLGHKNEPYHVNEMDYTTTTPGYQYEDVKKELQKLCYIQK
jgi:hypothetical protein